MICSNIHKKQLPVIILHEILGRFPNISNSYHISEMLGPVFFRIRTECVPVPFLVCTSSDLLFRIRGSYSGGIRFIRLSSGGICSSAYFRKTHNQHYEFESVAVKATNHSSAKLSTQSRQCVRLSLPISVHVFPHHLCFAVHDWPSIDFAQIVLLPETKNTHSRLLRNNRHSANRCYAGQRTIFAEHLCVSCPWPGCF